MTYVTLGLLAPKGSWAACFFGGGPLFYYQ